MHPSASHTIIYDLVTSIQPFDELERQHIAHTLQWVQSGAQLFRLAKPDIPDQHLVSYFVVFDPNVDKLLLIDHRKANAWLPTGGHVELNEHPRTTVQRESQEELGCPAQFNTVFKDRPLFITVNATTGHGSHTDISLWYVVQGNSQRPVTIDPAEARGTQWMSYQEILGLPIERLDRHMHRFVGKFQSMLLMLQ